MKRGWMGVGIAAAAACFGLGVAAARLLAVPPLPDRDRGAAVGPAYVVVSPVDAGLGPRIVFDPASIQLMPDAALRLELPPGFDAGAR